MVVWPCWDDIVACAGQCRYGTAEDLNTLCACNNTVVLSNTIQDSGKLE